MKPRRGDVVLLDYPYSDATGSKVRLALIVQGDMNNVRLDRTIVALITKNTQRTGVEPAHLLIDIGTTDGAQSGLRVTSAVTCNNLYTVYNQFLLKTIGTLPPALMNQLNDCLKAALGLT